MAISERIGIIRFCETPKDKTRIMYRLGLNNVQAESFLAILTKQSLLTQNNGKYVTTVSGQSYISSHNRIRKIKS
jgi:predicted transcriptional regulator